MRHLGTQILKTERLTLRPFQLDDAQAMFENWASREAVTRTTQWKRHESVFETEGILSAWCALYDDARIYNRERLRLEMSLRHARQADGEAPITAMMHFPPLTADEPGFSDILEAYGVTDCVYGHLHGPAIYGAVRGLRGSVRYHQVSCDGLGFRLYQLYE